MRRHIAWSPCLWDFKKMNKKTIYKCLRFLEIIELKSSGVQGELFYIREALNDSIHSRPPRTKEQIKKFTEGLKRYHKDQKKLKEKSDNDRKNL